MRPLKYQLGLRKNQNIIFPHYLSRGSAARQLMEVFGSSAWNYAGRIQEGSINFCFRVKELGSL